MEDCRGLIMPGNPVLRKGHPMADPVTSMYPAGHAIDTLKIVNPAPSVDPAMMALMGNRDNGLFGSGGNGLLALLIGAFLFGGRGGLLGGAGAGHGGAGAFAAEAVASQSIFTPKDTSLQLSSFQNWAQTNAAQLAQQCCCSTSQIISAVNSVNDRMFAAFVAQAQAQTAQLNSMQSVLTTQASTGFAAQTEKLSDVNQNLSNILNLNGRAIEQTANIIQRDVAAGFAASQLSECQTQNLINSTSCETKGVVRDGNYALSRQLADCCCENRLAVANQSALIERTTAALANQMSMQTCSIEKAIAADGAATRALINDQRVTELEQQLTDAKADARENAILAEVSKRCGHGHGHGDGGGSITNNVNITDIVTALARALSGGGSNGNNGNGNSLRA